MEIQSLARGLTILKLLADAENGIGITELARTLQVDKGSASRLVQTLAKYGYAVKDAETRRYRLGPQVVTLSRSLIGRISVREQASPYLHQLVEETGECAHLAILAQGQALYIDQEESPQTLRVSTGVGTLAPLHCTALGKVLLAFGNAPLPPDCKSFTPHTITDPAALERHLEQTKRRGYAVDNEEFEPGVRCIAVPIYDFRDKLVGAIGISGPATRVGLERIPRLAKTVCKIGQALSGCLGSNRI